MLGKSRAGAGAGAQTADAGCTRMDLAKFLYKWGGQRYNE